MARSYSERNNEVPPAARPGVSIACRLAALSLLVLVVALAVPAPRGAAAQEAWLGPKLPRAPHTRILGAPDWIGLFDPDRPWPRAAARTSMISMQPGYVMDAPDGQLATVWQAMQHRGLGVAMAIQPVEFDRSEPCGRTEGYEEARTTAGTVARLRKAGITPKYLAMDGPLWFGHYAQGPLECRFSIEETAIRTARTLRPYLQAFPDIQLGDIEGVPVVARQPGWEKDYRTFMRLLEAEVGRRVSFLNLDVNWHDPAWPDYLRTVAAFAKSEKMELGIIYNGDGTDPDAQAWNEHARRNFVRIESALGIIPARAVFSTWSPFPDHLLPETDPTAHAWLVAQYALPRTRIEITPSAGTLSGRLVDDKGAGLGGQTVHLDINGMDPDSPPPARTLAGTVPDKARFGLIVMGINRDCNCNGMNDLVLGAFTYRETGGGGATGEYDFPAFAKREQGDRSGGVVVRAGSVKDTQIGRVVVPPGQAFGFGSKPFAVTPGARYTFRAPMGSLLETGLFGAVTLIWQGENHERVGSVVIRVDDDHRPGVSVLTGSDGRFSVSRPGGATAAGFRFRFDGAPNLRPAIAEVPG